MSHTMLDPPVAILKNQKPLLSKSNFMPACFCNSSVNFKFYWHAIDSRLETNEIESLIQRCSFPNAQCIALFTSSSFLNIFCVPSFRLSRSKWSCSHALGLSYHHCYNYYWYLLSFLARFVVGSDF